MTPFMQVPRGHQLPIERRVPKMKKDAVPTDRALFWFYLAWRLAFGGLFVVSRRQFARLRVGVERFGEAFALPALFLGRLADDIDALTLQLGFIVRASDVSLHHHVHFRVKCDAHVEHADGLDRSLE